MVQTARRPDLTPHMTAPPARSAAAPGRRFGYVVSAAINLAMLWIAHQLLEWEWPRFLTDDFERVLPIITVAALAAVALNVAYLAFDPPWFRSLGNIVTSALGIAAAAWMLAVFPFDFSTYARDWSWAARAVLIVGIVGGAIGVLVELGRLVLGRSPRRGAPDELRTVDADFPGAGRPGPRDFRGGRVAGGRFRRGDGLGRARRGRGWPRRAPDPAFRCR